MAHDLKFRVSLDSLAARKQAEKDDAYFDEVYQDRTVNISATSSGFQGVADEVRTTREQLDKLREAYDTLSTKSSKVSSSRSLKKYVEEAKTLSQDIAAIYSNTDIESENRKVGHDLFGDSLRLEKNLRNRLESAKATEKENKALRQQAQEIQRVNSAYQQFYTTVSRVKALSSGGANGAYSYNAFNADGTLASTNVAGLLGAATNFTLHGTPYDPTIGQAIMAYPANPYAGTGYTLGGSYGGKSSYRAAGTINKNPNVIYVDDFGNVSYTPPSKAIPALPAGTPDMTDYSSLAEVRGGFGSNGRPPRIGKDGKPAKGLFEEVLGTSLGNYMKRIATYQAVSATVYGTVQAFKDALGTMKEVDSELASIQKVTDFSAEQMKTIEEGAYDTASKYGVQAQEYLESVSAFAKAGYKDLADELGELAIKTQLVGDVTASTANQFLLSVDAAWDMKGSVTDLSRVLDEANEVENNYATSIDKLAQGLPNVASVASMAGMSAEQTIAALGTITAVTQQSGTKAATALRALILNIMKDTTTEVEDGVTVTKEQISTLDEVLQTYAADAISAAEATGEIVNPMEVVAALAKAYNDNKISDKDLAKIEMALGGKLRTNQLDALLKNFGMYEEMMGKIAESAGSADKEVGIMLDTWQAKSDILKNTWTQFVADTLDTKLFKGILDFATDALKSIGNLQNGLVELLSVIALFKAQKIADFLSSFGLGTVSAGTVGAIAATIGAVYAVYTKYREGIEENAESTMKEAEASMEQSQKLMGLVSAYENAAQGSQAYKDASAQLATALGLEGDAVNSLADSYKRLTAEKLGENGAVGDAAEARAAAGKALETAYAFSFGGASVRYTDLKLQRKYSDINDIINKGLEGVTEVRSNGLFSPTDISREGLIEYYKALEQTIKDVKDAAESLSKEQQDEIFGANKYKDLVKARDGLKEYVDNYQSAYKLWVESSVQETVFDKMSKGLLDTQEEYDDFVEKLKDTWQGDALEMATEFVEKTLPQFSGYVDDATKALAEEEAQLASTTSALDRYKKAMSGGEDGKGEKDDNFKTVAGAFKTMQDEAKNKRFASNAFMDSAKLVLGEDYASRFQSNDEIAKHIKDLDKMGVFKEDSAGTGLFNLISKSDAAKKTADGLYEIGDGLASVKKNADGTFKFDITDDLAGLEELSKILGVSSEALISMQQAMGVFDGSIDTEGLQTQLNTVDEFRDKIEELASEEHTVTFDTNENEVVGQIDNIKSVAKSAATRYIMNFLATLKLSFSGGFGGRGAEGDNTTPHSATGTSSFKGGITWVNDEKGGFNPELIETGGKSFFVNGGKPALVSLPKGTIIHNATDTRKMFAQDFTEVPHYKTGTAPLPNGLADRSGRIAGIGSGKGSASSGDWWEKLQEYMEDLLEKAGDALDKQLEAIDAELFYLQYGKEVSEKATKLEEARMDLLEAEQELINAQTERTVRYFNAETGQWEWMADQKDILKAQEDLAEKQKDYLQAQYDYLEDVWSELKDDIQKAIDGKKDVNIENVLKRMMKSKAGGLTGNVEGVIGDLLNLITALSNGTALDSYDSGGIANGLGYMFKATKADEVVLNGKLSNAILSPKRSQQFADFTSSLERMFGMSAMMDKPQSRMGFSSTDSHNNIVYMNGIKIGSDMLNKPLSEVLSVLPIYCN